MNHESWLEEFWVEYALGIIDEPGYIKPRKPEAEIMAELNRLEDIRAAYKLRAIWSVGPSEEVFDLDAPHPFPEVTELGYSAHWGPKLVTALIEGPKWMDLWVAADKAIKMSGDDHHVFIEHFAIGASGMLELYTGS